MPAIAMQTELVPGRDVQVGTYLAYLSRPFVVTRIEPMEPHEHLGARRIAYDDQGRGVIVYDALTATIVR